ncbi:hypothetical protein NDU88_003109 [Pleurodeles waltl]|uniref:Uncharacterized protein n=1 Tax=Pleurodeles waltl TaxID=8319 RepID=A0AAV7TQ88_PLEWA|nr:hypothetical protein NDU88_003109 [Pleurodeles waltl]
MTRDGTFMQVFPVPRRAQFEYKCGRSRAGGCAHEETWRSLFPVSINSTLKEKLKDVRASSHNSSQGRSQFFLCANCANTPVDKNLQKIRYAPLRYALRQLH